MKLLLDANISWRLTEKLKRHFTDCFHVDNIGLKVPVSDIEIWNYAATEDLVIVTNDEDFLNLSNTKGFPPKIILLRTGNQSTSYIEQLLIDRRVEIIQFKTSSEQGCLEILSF